MPSELPVIPISYDEFETMPHRLGWKHEYWEGAARLSPASTAIAKYTLSVFSQNKIDTIGESIFHCKQPRIQGCDSGTPDVDSKANLSPSSDGHTVRLAYRSDTPELIELFKRAFEDSIVYCGYSDRAYDEEARRTISLEKAHILIAEQQGSIIGAIKLRLPESQEATNAAIIEPIMVEPATQRQGVARELLRWGVALLASLEVPTLHSHCHLGNTPSLCWHEKHEGFVGVEDRFSLNARKYHHISMVKHYESCGNKAAAELARQRVAYYSQQEERLNKW